MWLTFNKQEIGQDHKTAGHLYVNEYLDLPRRKRPVVDSFGVLNPPQ